MCRRGVENTVANVWGVYEEHAVLCRVIMLGKGWQTPPTPTIASDRLKVKRIFIAFVFELFLRYNNNMPKIKPFPSKYEP